MPKKSTTNLENELKSCANLENFLNQNQSELSNAPLAEHIQNMIASKSMTRADVVKACNLNEIYAYQIISGARRPSRDKLLCLCIAMKASLEETQELLYHGGFAPLYVRSQRDSIIIFGISHGESILQVNSNLYDHGESLLE